MLLNIVRLSGKELKVAERLLLAHCGLSDFIETCFQTCQIRFELLQIEG